jgi:integrase
LKTSLKARKLAPASLADYLRIFNRVAVAAFDGEVLPLPDNAAEQLQQHLYRLEDQGYAPVTLRNHLVVMRYYADALGTPTVFDQVRSPAKVRKQVTQTVLDAEVEAVFKALQALDPAAKTLFELVLLTGMRLGELLGLKYTRDDLKSRRVLVKSASGALRPLFLGTRAAALLGPFLNPRKRLPRGEKGRIRLSTALRQACVDAGVPDVTASRLRMTYAVRMVLAGHDLEFVATNLGLSRGSYEARRRLKDVLVDHLSRVPADAP